MQAAIDLNHRLGIGVRPNCDEGKIGQDGFAGQGRFDACGQFLVF